MQRAHRRLAHSLLALWLAGAASSAAALQYNVIATAGGDGASHQSIDDPDAIASFIRSAGTGSDTYSASANLATGSLDVDAQIVNGSQLSFSGVQARSSARIEETIAFQQSLAGPVTIKATFGSGLSAQPPEFNVGAPAAAQASGYVELAGCRLSVTQTNGVNEETSLCPNSGLGWSTAGSSVTIVIDPQIFPTTTSVDIEAQVDALFLNPNNVQSGHASAGGTVSVSLSPNIAVSYTGTQTSFPVPEPEESLLGLAALAALGRLAKRRRSAPEAPNRR